MKQWDSHLLHRFKVKNKNYVITFAQVGCGYRGVDNGGTAGGAFAAPTILGDATFHTKNHVFFCFLFVFV